MRPIWLHLRMAPPFGEIRVPSRSPRERAGIWPARRGGLSLRPLDAVAAMRRNLDPYTRQQVEGILAPFDPQGRRAGHEHNELVLVLIVPEVRRARLTTGNDPLDSDVATNHDGLAELFRETFRQSLEKISCPHRSSRRVRHRGSKIPWVGQRSNRDVVFLFFMPGRFGMRRFTGKLPEYCDNAGKIRRVQL